MSVLDLDRIEIAFNEFHREFPEVYSRLVRLSHDWVAAGHARLGIATLFERLRWEWHFAGEDADGFKLNNNFRALYARKIMEENPSLDGLFLLRERRAPKIGFAE